MPAPTNDNFASRIALTTEGGFVGPVTIDLATTEVGEPAGSNVTNGVFQTIWYSWTCPLSGTYSFDTGTRAGAQVDTTLAVWTGTSLGSLVEVASNDDTPGFSFGSQVVFAATAGTTYQIQIGTYDGTATGNVYLNWTAPIAGSDSFAGRVALSGGRGRVGPTTIDTFTVEGGEQAGVNITGGTGGLHKTLWYSWTCPADDTYTFDTDVIVGTQVGSTLAVWTGSTLGSLTEVASNDGNSNFDAASVTFAGAAGTVYLIQVGTFSGTATGDQYLNWAGTGYTPPAASNDSCANAADLGAGFSGTVNADNTLWAGTWPTGSDPTFNHFGFGGGAPLWWKWSNTMGYPILFRVTLQDSASGSPITATNFALMVGTCGSLTIDDTTRLSLNGVSYSDADPTLGFIEDLVVPAGATVYLEIDSYTNDASEPPTAASADRGSFMFDWEALPVSLKDSMAGTDTELVADVTSGAAGAFTVLASAVFGTKVYMAWVTAGTDLMVGTCNLDGTGLTAHLATAATSDDYDHKFVYDGNLVYFGFARIEPMVSPSGYTAEYLLFKVDGTGAVALVNHFQNDGDPTNATPATSSPGGYLYYYTLLAADPSRPDELWLMWSYNRHVETSGSVDCVESGGSVVSYPIVAGDGYSDEFWIAKIVPSLAATRTSLSEWVPYIHSESSGATQSAFNGSYTCLHPGVGGLGYDNFDITAPTSATAVSWGKAADLDLGSGYPLLVGAAPISFGLNGRVWDNNITVMRVDTWTSVGTFTHDTLAGAVEANKHLKWGNDNSGGVDGGHAANGSLQSVKVHPPFSDAEAGATRQFLTMWWRDVSTSSDEIILVLLPPGLAAATQSPALPYLSSRVTLLDDVVLAVKKDGVRDIYSLGQDNVIDQFDRVCALAWRRDVSSANSTSITKTYNGDQNSWDGDSLYLMLSDKSVYRWTIQHDTDICSVGAVVGSGLQAWQRF